jgi:hypothetical protein
VNLTVGIHTPNEPVQNAEISFAIHVVLTRTWIKVANIRLILWTALSVGMITSLIGPGLEAQSGPGFEIQK